MNGIKNNKGFAFILSLSMVVGISACKTPESLSEIPLVEYEWSPTIGEFTSDENLAVEKQLHYADFYTDPLLIELIETGLNNNLDLQVLQRRVKQAEESYLLSTKAWLPGVSLGLNGNVSVFPLDKDFNDWGRLEMSDFSISTGQWEIDIWGKLKYLKDAKKALFLQMELTEKQLKNTLVSQIAQSYYQLITYNESLRVTEKTVENWEQTVETMRALKISGRVTEAAVTQSIAQLSAVEASVSDLKVAKFATEQRINLLLGRVNQPIQTKGIEEDEDLPIIEVGIPSDLLVLRPDLRIAYEKVKEAFFEKEAAKTYFLPSLTLSGKLGFQANDFKDFINPLSLLGNIAGGLLQPIFQKGVNKARLNIAKEEELAMLLELEYTYIQACMEVEELLYAYQQAGIKTSHIKNQIEQSRSSVDYTEELLESGFAIYTEVITAKQQLLQAELSGINNYITKQSILIQLYNASGGGI